jgi:hypothetical protein
MKRILLALIVLTTVTLNNGFTQPPWYYTNTGSNHTVLIQTGTPITINNVQLTTGDYIGVFYDSLGTLSCGGYISYSSSTLAVAAWGDDVGSTPIEGFASNEEFKWKIWRASDSTEFNAIASYWTVGMPNQGNFSSNGMSGVAALTAIIGSDVAVGNITAPSSSCGDLTATETFSFQVLNLGITAVDTVMVSFSVDAGLTVYRDTIVQLLPVGSNLVYTATQTFDFSAIGSYDCIITVENSMDDTPSNDTLYTTINNFLPAPVSMIGFDTAYCTSNVPFQLVSSHPGGIYIITPANIPVIVDQIYFTTPGAYTLNYSYTDSNNCVSSAIEDFQVYQTPEIELGPTVQSCEGENVILSVSSGYTTYNWSTGSSDTSIVISNSGLYSISVSGSNGCERIDSVDVVFNPLPIIDIQGDTSACEGETINLSAAGQGTSFVWSTGSSMDNITVGASGSYSVTVTELGCPGVDDIDVVIHDNPIFDLGSDIETCDGETIVLDAGVWVTYLWSNGSTAQTIDVTSTGAFGVAITDEFGCLGGDNITVTFNPLPIADFSYSINNTLVTFANQSSFADSYSWDFDNGMTSTNDDPIIEFGTYDTYSVELTATNGCGDDVIVIDVIVLSIDELAFNNRVQVWPNPATDVVNISIEVEMTADTYLHLTDATGKLIINQEILKTNTSIDLSEFSPGVYFIKVNSSTDSYIRKIVKQ